MTMTVRQLIEHLAQYDPEMEVYIRDPENTLVLFDLSSHAVQREQYIQGTETTPKLVVAIG